MKRISDKITISENTKINFINQDKSFDHANLTLDHIDICNFSDNAQETFYTINEQYSFTPVYVLKDNPEYLEYLEKQKEKENSDSNDSSTDGADEENTEEIIEYPGEIIPPEKIPTDEIDYYAIKYINGSIDFEIKLTKDEKELSMIVNNEDEDEINSTRYIQVTLKQIINK